MCKEHNAFLESKFQQSANWTKAQIQELASQLQIPYVKIYKWNWERKKKVLNDQSRQQTNTTQPGQDSTMTTGSEGAHWNFN